MSDFIIENRILVRYTGKSKEVVIPKGVTIIGNADTNRFSACRYSTVKGRIWRIK